MSEVFSTLEVLSRGRYVPHASTNEFQAQPRRYEPHASTNESQVQPGRYEQQASTNESQVQPGPYEQQASTNESQAMPGRYEQQASTNESQEQPLVLIVNANDFSALEERIVRTVEMVKWERQGRMVAEERALQAEAALNEHAQRIDALERELHALNSERDHAHLRVERLLVQLDALELSGSAEPGRRPVTSILDRPATGEGARGKSSAATG